MSYLRAYSYTDGGNGAVLVTKVALGKPYVVNAFGAPKFCPTGYNSVSI